MVFLYRLKLVSIFAFAASFGPFGSLSHNQYDQFSSLGLKFGIFLPVAADEFNYRNTSIGEQMI